MVTSLLSHKRANVARASKTSGKSKEITVVKEEGNAGIRWAMAADGQKEKLSSSSNFLGG